MEEKSTMCLSDEKTHYVDVFFFKGTEVVKHDTAWYESEEKADNIYSRGINKYKQSGKSILICLRDREHNLIKSELVK